VWRGGEPTAETLLAATATNGAPAGTLPVVASTEEGELEVGVWRWPFDPFLPALESCVRKSGVRALLVDAGLVDDATPVELSVRAYRPTERAVVRVHGSGRTWYLKVLRPHRTASIADRHERFAASGIPVPLIAAADHAGGWLLLDEFAGPTLRELIKEDAATWTVPERLCELVTSISSAPVDGLTPTRSRLRDAPVHADVLARVLPSEAPRLERLADRFRTDATARSERPPRAVHGDLHEGQLIVNDGLITGLLDIDDVGIGDPIDDAVVPMGHLRYRASTTTPNPVRLDTFVDRLAELFARDHDSDALAIGTAAVLTGIAAAPFRSQREGWQGAVVNALDLVERTWP
jgi:aminoglycoside phosphotransferase